mmetsp:Transcript_127927/g.239282  ORF Transcript_127927/g.239282 Transcript_127927/m.239282 type:complete len:384 (+) Transcript_127927:101-1252(+)
MGTYLATPVTQKEREDGRGPRSLRFGAASMQGWRVAQEDAHIALPDYDASRKLGLFAVFDGHCGSAVSNLVAELLPKELQKSPSFKAGDYPAALYETFLALDEYLDSLPGRRVVREIADKAQSSLASILEVEGSLTESDLTVPQALEELCAGDPDETGCTAVVALLEYGPPARLHVANCGDSRAVLWDEQGKAIPMSKDHKPRCKEERARIEAAGGWVNWEGRIEGNLNLSRALADFEYKRTRNRQRPEKQMISGVPDVRSRELLASDRFLLLGCDGVWETRRSSQATVNIVRQQLPSTKRAKLSVALGQFFDKNIGQGDSTDGLGLDNMTAVLVELPRLTPAKESKHQRQTGTPTKARGVRKTIRKRPAAGALLPRLPRPVR